jgi:Zn-dependent peptidase ImmA (M78 family)
MSAQVARNAAERLVRSLDIFDAPVDVKNVARRLGVSVMEEELGDVSGVLVRRAATGVICVHRGHPKVRQRFTIAHELGHFVLAHPMEPGEQVHVDKDYVVSLRDNRSATGAYQKEVEANAFAASLLMPASFVRSAVSALDSDEITDGTIESLADDFGVSAQAMTIRLSSLGILR